LGLELGSCLRCTMPLNRVVQRNRQEASVLLIMDVGRGKPPKSQASWRTERRVATFQNPVRLQNGEALSRAAVGNALRGDKRGAERHPPFILC
jgi:hypothetical protein